MSPYATFETCLFFIVEDSIEKLVHRNYFPNVLLYSFAMFKGLKKEGIFVCQGVKNLVG